MSAQNAPSAIDELRGATRELHDRLEAYPYAQRVLDGTVPLSQYTMFLRALEVVHRAVEDVASGSDDQRVTTLWDGVLPATPALERDLAHLSSLGHGSVGAPDAATALAANIRTLAAEDPSTVAGVLYVLEGSKMGGLVQSAALASMPALRTAGRDYLSAEGSRSRAAFRAFVARLNAVLGPGRDAASGAVRGAVATFQGFIAIVEAVSAIAP
jgi:heme oxygenase